MSLSLTLFQPLDLARLERRLRDIGPLELGPEQFTITISGFDGDAVAEFGGVTPPGDPNGVWLTFDLFDGPGGTLIASGTAIDGPLVNGAPDLRAAIDGGLDVAGSSGPDVVNGGAELDLLDAGGGADTLRGFGGDDIIFGGGGDDLLLGGGGADNLFGDVGDDVLRGQGGGDFLFGGPGGDRLVGGAGADLLAGGAGDDTLVGGPGDDTLAAGPGRDLLRGGSGRDTYEIGATEGGRKRIFLHAREDRIEIFGATEPPDVSIDVVGVNRARVTVEDADGVTTQLVLVRDGGVRFNAPRLRRAIDVELDAAPAEEEAAAAASPPPLDLF